jgi:hypothetical protein
MSLSVPDPMLRLGAAKKPAKKRKTTSAAILGANPVPRMKSAKIGRLMKITGRLPNVSLKGAANGPPKARPSWYMENANVAMTLVEWNSKAAGSMPGVNTDDAKVPTKATPEIVYVWNHFLAGLQLCGFRESSAPSQSRVTGRSCDCAESVDVGVPFCYESDCRPFSGSGVAFAGDRELSE